MLPEIQPGKPQGSARKLARCVFRINLLFWEYVCKHQPIAMPEIFELGAVGRDDLPLIYIATPF
jgi:hypothetical protein